MKRWFRGPTSRIIQVHIEWSSNCLQDIISWGWFLLKKNVGNEYLKATQICVCKIIIIYWMNVHPSVRTYRCNTYDKRFLCTCVDWIQVYECDSYNFSLRKILNVKHFCFFYMEFAKKFSKYIREIITSWFTGHTSKYIQVHIYRRFFWLITLIDIFESEWYNWIFIYVVKKR